MRSQNGAASFRFERLFSFVGSARNLRQTSFRV